ncbi:hypothetical protein NLC27_02720 [Candidatus Aminicenantes bacterium AC-708-I09]|nr:hypothetical protein [Candidatus Aminicenantes bacterium AC-708-I09]
MKRFIHVLIIFLLFTLINCKTVIIPPKVDVSLIEKLAVLPFTGSYTYAEIGRKLADGIVIEFSMRPINFEVLDPGIVDSALRNTDISMFITIDPTKIGEYLKVSTLLMGRIEEFLIPPPRVSGPYFDKKAQKNRYKIEQESVLSVTFRVIDVKTGNVLFANREVTSIYQYDYYYEDEEVPVLDMSPYEIERELIRRTAYKIARNFLPL